MTKNILLVDDEIIFNMVNKKILERGSQVESIDSVVNGREAINFLEQRIQTKLPLPELILLDLNMPIMNGFEFLEEIQNHPAIDHKAMAIVILSSSFDPRDKARARELGATDFLEKPLTVDGLTKWL
jgi:CheY-like chemotaxis protein